MIERTAGALERLRHTDGFALDMDGTTYLGGRLLPGARDFVDLCLARGLPFVFLTNNSSRSREEYGQKIRGMGLPVGADHVMTSGEAAIAYLHRERPGQRVLLFATPSFRQEVVQAGVPLADRIDEADLVLLAYDTTMDFARLVRLCDAVRAGLPLVATHPDVNCPVEGGYWPDVGAFLALVERSTGRGADLVIGKPETRMAQAVSERLGRPLARLAYIGDRLYTDVAMARRSGMLAVLVLSGETSLADLESVTEGPDLVFRDLQEVADLLAATAP
ncbi:MAG TPA: HAD-IIA family hydrolase [Myxococcota bacterium]|nr:HAD-IIA family hydrolase [Myxococcota bacterium]HQK51892.1 HAD-IIA family hydrolase [Myxococcota bacterium]